MKLLIVRHGDPDYYFGLATLQDALGNSDATGGSDEA